MGGTDSLSTWPGPSPQSPARQGVELVCCSWQNCTARGTRGPPLRRSLPGLQTTNSARGHTSTQSRSQGEGGSETATSARAPNQSRGRSTLEASPWTGLTPLYGETEVMQGSMGHTGRPCLQDFLVLGCRCGRPHGDSHRARHPNTTRRAGGTAQAVRGDPQQMLGIAR